MQELTATHEDRHDKYLKRCMIYKCKPAGEPQKGDGRKEGCKNRTK
jgi:hypothetical protein